MLIFVRNLVHVFHATLVILVVSRIGSVPRFTVVTEILLHLWNVNLKSKIVYILPLLISPILTPNPYFVIWLLSQGLIISPRIREVHIIMANGLILLILFSVTLILSLVSNISVLEVISVIVLVALLLIFIDYIRCVPVLHLKNTQSIDVEHFSKLNVHISF